MLNNPDPVNQYKFGYSVAISGSRAVVGALNFFSAHSPAGSAYVYDLSNATPSVSVAKLDNPAPPTGEVSGFSVAISGNRIAVGVPYDDFLVPNKGYAYVFGPSGPNTAPTVTLTGANPLIIEAGGIFTDPGATASDSWDGELTPVITSNNVNATVPGTSAVTPGAQQLENGPC